jgi:hypothetical protein
MPVLTGATLFARVREYTDQPANGDGTRAFITDTMLGSWLTHEYREMLRACARYGLNLGVTRAASSAPGSSISVGSSGVIAILGVYHYDGTTRYALPRINEVVGPGLTGQCARYWRPSITTAGVVTIDLYPGESTHQVEYHYIAEPSEITTATTTLYFPAHYDEVAVLGAALRAQARSNEDNSGLRGLYLEAVQAAEAALTQGVDRAILNTDDVYRPGYDQGRAWDEGREWSLAPWLPG